MAQTLTITECRDFHPHSAGLYFLVNFNRSLMVNICNPKVEMLLALEMGYSRGC